MEVEHPTTQNLERVMRPAIKSSITKRYDNIPFGHRQPAHDGHCRWIHGHNWSFEVTVTATTRDQCGFILDYGKMKFIKNYLNSYDHALLIASDDPELATFRDLEQRDLCFLLVLPDVSCEGLADWLLEELNRQLDETHAERGVLIERVQVWEDTKNTAVAEWAMK